MPMYKIVSSEKLIFSNIVQAKDADQAKRMVLEGKVERNLIDGEDECINVSEMAGETARPTERG